MKAKMSGFDNWWGLQPKNPTEPITPRMAWNAAQAAANERIRELEAALAMAVARIFVAEEVSDKLEKALQAALEVGSHLMRSADYELARAALAEVAAIRKGEKQ